MCRVATAGVGPSDTNSKLVFLWSSSPSISSVFIESADPCGLNVLCTTMIIMTNTAPGVTTITMYVNGVQEAQAAGQTVCDVAFTTASQEDQWQTGSGFHVYAGQWFNTFFGSVYQNGLGYRASGPAWT